jgi:ABC-2 type transport system ATP-binding protein
MKTNEKKSSNVIRVNQVCKSYKNINVLKQLSINVEPGQIIGLVGRNGAGKSTLIESIMGLREIESGEIKIWGQALGDLPQEQKELIGFVPQDSIGFEWMKVGHYLEYFGGFFSNWDKEHSLQLTKRWNLNLKSRIADLSGGQQQILQVIQALSIRPQLLILDEPVAHLDPNMRRQFLAELIELTCELGTTIIFSTHIISDLERVASHIALLNDGVIEHLYDLEDLKAHAASILFDSDNPLLKEINHLINWQKIEGGSKGIIASPNALSIVEIEQQFKVAVNSQPLSLEDWYLEVTNIGSQQ